MLRIWELRACSLYERDISMITTSKKLSNGKLSKVEQRTSMKREELMQSRTYTLYAAPPKTRDRVRRVTVIGNHVPRQCGIATFTSHLVEAISASGKGLNVSVAAMNDIDEGYRYPSSVRYEIKDENINSYSTAANQINWNGADVVSLQHEFGIFGGPAGSHLLELLKGLKMPVVATLHTVLREPNRDQRHVMNRLRDLCERFVVMSERAVGILENVYGFERDRIDMIHHGIPDVSFAAKRSCMESKSVCDGKLLLTLGLLGPGKGIEYAIRALPEIVKRHPKVVYMIAGTTHPSLVRNEGEQYRESLLQIARDLNVTSNVLFYNRFVSQEELELMLMAADVYITPYPHLEQICSGTLAYAVGCGNAVVSTPFWHAQELLADGRGILVDPCDPLAISRSVIELLDHPDKLLKMQQHAHNFGRQMVWSRVAALYMDSFNQAISPAKREPTSRRDYSLHSSA
jgi:glycosyltransferase involved in cell wall biosynthesis